MNIKLKITILLTTFLVVSNIVQVFAITEISNESKDSDIQQPNPLILTYDQAIESALKSSRLIKSANLDIERSNEIRNKADDQLTYMPTWFNNTQVADVSRGLFYGLIQADIGLKTSKKQLTAAEQSVAFTTLRTYNELLSLQKEVELNKSDLERLEREKNIVSIKNKYGLATSLELQEAEKAIKESEYSLLSNIEKFKEKKIVFNNLLGFSPDKEYILIDEPEFHILDYSDEKLLYHISNVIMDSNPVWIAEQNMKFAQIDLDLYVYNDPNSLPYRAKEIDLDKANMNVAETKRRLEETIHSTYRSIKQLEHQYSILRLKLDNAEKMLVKANIQYEIGLITLNDVKETEFIIEKLNKNMLDVILQHEQLKYVFHIPWVAMN